MMNYKNKNLALMMSMVLVLMSVVFNACRKYENPPQVFEEYGDNMQGKSERKVLIINIDGAVGSEVKKINPTNIAALVKNGKFSFTALPDAVSSDAGSLASMLTGVASAKHAILDDSYTAVKSADDDHAVITNYPTFLSRLLDVRPEFKTVTITTDAALNKYLIHADHRILTANDAAVKDSTVNILQANNAKIVMVDFRDVKTVGTAAGFLADVPAYKAAIEKVDGYIGEITAALKKRKNYASEDWLIIVTTNRGGNEINPKQGFIICSNPGLKEEEVKKLGFNTMRFNAPTTAAVIKNDNGLYDPGTNKDFTVQLQAKFNNNANWPGFFSKSTDVRVHKNTGWTMIFNGGNWEVVLGGTDNGGSSYRMGGPQVAGGKWHTLTLTVKTVGATRTATIYTDGIKNLSTDVTGAKNLSTIQPLKLGYRNQDDSGTQLDFNAGDVEYFNVALDDATVLANVNLKDITKHPKYANLIGYWPFDDGAGAVISNAAPVGLNFLMAGSGKWESLGNDIPVSRTPMVIPGGATSVVPVGADIAALTFYWLKVPIKSDWSLDGSPWISSFELEFIK